MPPRRSVNFFILGMYYVILSRDDRRLGRTLKVLKDDGGCGRGGNGGARRIEQTDCFLFSPHSRGRTTVLWAGERAGERAPDNLTFMWSKMT